MNYLLRKKEIEDFLGFIVIRKHNGESLIVIWKGAECILKDKQIFKFNTIDKCQTSLHNGKQTFDWFEW